MMNTGMTRKILAGAIIAACALGGCGIKGDLKTPPPLWGDPDKPAGQDQTPAEQKPAPKA